MGAVEMRKRSRLLPAVVVVAVLLATFGVSVATGVVSLPEPFPPAAPTSSTISAQLASNFGALRNDSSPNATSASAVGTLDVGLVAQFGINSSLAVQVGSHDGRQIWLVPGTQGVCIYLSASSTGPSNSRCTSTERALEGQLQMELVPNSGNPTIYGLAPDSNTQVGINSNGKSATTAPVASNVYVLEVTPGTESVAVSNASGAAQTVPVPVPAQ
jgi:hypothetical protein